MYGRPPPRDVSLVLTVLLFLTKSDLIYFQPTLIIKDKTRLLSHYERATVTYAGLSLIVLFLTRRNETGKNPYSLTTRI